MNSPSLCVKDVRTIPHELKKIQKDYTEKFRTKTRNLKDQALQYLKGKFLERGPSASFLHSLSFSAFSRTAAIF